MPCGHDGVLTGFDLLRREGLQPASSTTQVDSRDYVEDSHALKAATCICLLLDKMPSDSRVAGNAAPRSTIAKCDHQAPSVTTERATCHSSSGGRLPTPQSMSSRLQRKNLT